MPFLRVDLAGPVDATMKRDLPTRTTALFAELTESLIDRIRTQVHELPADSFAVAGVPIAGCGLHRRVGPGGLDLAYWLGVRSLGRGWATVTARALIEAAFGVDDVIDEQG